jgi:hypothetical protein
VGAQRVLSLHGIGAPHHGVTEDERFYWLGREAFVALLQTIVVTREGSDLPVVITFDDGNQAASSPQVKPIERPTSSNPSLIWHG